MNYSGRNYGSRYHFQWYRDNDSVSLDYAINGAAEGRVSSLSWIYPKSPASGGEPTGIRFLNPTNEVQKAWASFWPIEYFADGEESVNAKANIDQTSE